MLNRCLKHVALFSALLVMLITMGCGIDNQMLSSEDANQAGSYSSAAEAIALIKSETTADLPSALLAPSTGNWSTSQYVDKATGGTITMSVPGVADSVEFQVAPNALVPLSGDGATISMEVVVEVTNNDLTLLDFVFGPSGTGFSPSAKIVIPFELLITQNIDDFIVTIDSGGQIEGTTYDVDWTNEALIAYAPHFSQYYFRR